MRSILASFLTVMLAVAVGGIGFVASGLYDVAATTPHWPTTTWLLQIARTRSIKAHAAGIPTPPGLDAPAKVESGVAHFAAHCAICHGAPGVPRGEIAQGLYPRPPNLATDGKQYSPAELFWILQHGIKTTGMPAWSDHSDAELWATVAFLMRLPVMTEAEYARMLMAGIARGGHHHTGGQPEKTED